MTIHSMMDTCSPESILFRFPKQQEKDELSTKDYNYSMLRV